MFRPCSQDSLWRGSAIPICESLISTPQRPCQVGACQLSSPSLLPLGPKVKFSFCSLVWFLVVPLASSAPEPLPSGFFRNFKVEISKLGLCFSWQVCNRWEISHWSYPILSLAKRHFQRWERLLETFYNGLSQPKIVTFFLLGDHAPSPTSLAIREESEDTDRKEITPLIHTRQNALRGREKSSDLEENCEAWVATKGWAGCNFGLGSAPLSILSFLGFPTFNSCGHLHTQPFPTSRSRTQTLSLLCSIEHN